MTIVLFHYFLRLFYFLDYLLFYYFLRRSHKWFQLFAFPISVEVNKYSSTLNRCWHFVCTPKNGTENLMIVDWLRERGFASMKPLPFRHPKICIETPKRIYSYTDINNWNYRNLVYQIRQRLKLKLIDFISFNFRSLQSFIVQAPED